MTSTRHIHKYQTEFQNIFTFLFSFSEIRRVEYFGLRVNIAGKIVPVVFFWVEIKNSLKLKKCSKIDLILMLITCKSTDSSLKRVGWLDAPI